MDVFAPADADKYGVDIDTMDFVKGVLPLALALISVCLGRW
jgi:hypothetical protein